MNDKRGQPTQLPKEPIDWVVQPITRFVKIEAAAGVVLLLSTLFGVIVGELPAKGVLQWLVACIAWNKHRYLFI